MDGVQVIVNTQSNLNGYAAIEILHGSRFWYYGSQVIREEVTRLRYTNLGFDPVWELYWRTGNVLTTAYVHRSKAGSFSKGRSLA